MRRRREGPTGAGEVNKLLKGMFGNWHGCGISKRDGMKQKNRFVGKKLKCPVNYNSWRQVEFSWVAFP